MHDKAEERSFGGHIVAGLFAWGLKIFAHNRDITMLGVMFFNPTL